MRVLFCLLFLACTSIAFETGCTKDVLNSGRTNAAKAGRTFRLFGPPAGLLDHIAQEIYDMHLLNYERLMDRVNEMLARSEHLQPEGLRRINELLGQARREEDVMSDIEREEEAAARREARRQAHFLHSAGLERAEPPGLAATEPNLLQNIFLEHWWRWHNLTTELRHAMARADSLEPAVQRRIEELTAQAREARDAMEGVQAQIHAAHHPRALYGAPGTV
ncbi:hypothetical protein OC844_006367 [Tilletia horrida]|nr:hypothetical protein OC844_006367 [Tilletia horrida]